MGEAQSPTTGAASGVWRRSSKKKHVREMDITGRSMKGWLLVDAPAIAPPARLKARLEIFRVFVATLPRK